MPKNIELFQGRCEDILPTLDDDSIDLVITSPPYNVDLGNNKYNKSPYDLYNDNKDHDKYIEWLRDIFAKVHQKLKSGGRVCINIGDGKNGAVQTHIDICHFMVRDLLFLPITTIIWRKSQIGNRTSWGSWQSPSCPSFPTPFEYILIFAKGDKKLRSEGITDIKSEHFKKWAFAEWTFAPENKMQEYDHPAMFPVELPYRCIQMLSWVGATVLDPFSGAGSTAVACRKTGRRFIGIELSQKYIDTTWKRLGDEERLTSRDLFWGEYEASTEPLEISQ